MSETQRNFFNKRTCGLWIAGAFVFLFSVFWAFFRPPAETEPLTIKVIEPPAERRVDRTPQSVFDSVAYYRPILEYNIFRPLGWTPPRPTEPYRLIGTILPRSTNTPPQAIIETTAGKKTYIVTIGDKIETHTEVVDIQPQQVTLSTDGKQRTLKLPIRF